MQNRGRGMMARHEPLASPRRPLGSHRTAAAEGAAETQGRPSLGPDHAALTGIVFVLRTGRPWRLWPKKLGSGSGWTCSRRLRDWQAAGIRERLHTRLLDWLGDEVTVDWSRTSVDSLSMRSKRGRSHRHRLGCSRSRQGRL